MRQAADAVTLYCGQFCEQRVRDLDFEAGTLTVRVRATRTACRSRRVCADGGVDLAPEVRMVGTTYQSRKWHPFMTPDMSP